MRRGIESRHASPFDRWKPETAIVPGRLLATALLFAEPNKAAARFTITRVAKSGG
jgi:hypothetical protein